MKLSESLAAVGHSFPYYPKLCPVVGGVKACIFLCAVFWRSYAEHDGWMQMSIEKLTEQTGLTPWEQREARSRLRSLGVLEERENRLAHQMFYRINCEALDMHFDSSGMDQAISRSEETSPARLPNPHSPELGNLTPTDKGKRPGKDPDKTKQQPPIPEALAAHPGIEEAWAMWAEHKRQKRDPITPLAAKLRLDELVAMGGERAVAAIRHSIACGYKGIFEPKPDFAAPQFRPPPRSAPTLSAKAQAEMDTIRERAELLRRIEAEDAAAREAGGAK